MAKQGGPKRKHVPQRTCVGCRDVSDKRDFVRLVRTPEGVFPDETGKMPGRGAYLHANRACFDRGLKGPLAGALRTQLSDADRQRLADFAERLPADKEADETIEETT